MLNIERIFREIIDTPESRAREVAEAGERAKQAFTFQRQRGGQTFGYGGSTLAGQIASDIPRNTENLRKTLIGLGADGLQTRGESLADELRGLDLTDPEAQEIAIQRVMAVDPAAGAALEDAYVQRQSQIDYQQNRFPVDSASYANGTTWVRTSAGVNQVRLADGTLVAPEDAEATIQAGLQSDIDQTRMDSQASREGSLVADEIKEVGDKIQLVYSKGDRYQQAINEIDAGADATYFRRFTPVFFQNPATVEFNQIAARLGLDVVGSVTFGALSQAELRVAMRTAVPDFKSNEQARAWFVEQLAAERALASELAEFQRYMQNNRGNYPNFEDFKLQIKRAFDEDPATVARRNARNAGVAPDEVTLTTTEEQILADIQARARANAAGQNGGNNGGPQ